jgi:large subunit ribosomal protein L6
MSKIGRSLIPLGGVRVEIQGRRITFTGKKASGVHELPAGFTAEISEGTLKIVPTAQTSTTGSLWGLHRALLANKIYGAEKEFERQIRIVGLGYKALVQGTTLQLTVGYTHKVNLAIPAGVTVEIDKTGQLLTLRSSQKDTLGQFCSDIRSVRPPEPYKGTGIQYVGEVIIRKAGKAKSA